MPQTDLISRLWWSGGRGVAHHAGVTVELSQAPALAGVTPTELDYAPALYVALLRLRSDARRDMTPAECAAALALLQRIASAAHAAAKTPTTQEEAPCQNAP